MPDRYGDPVDHQADDEPTRPRPTPAPRHDCDSGWLDRNADQPVPCLICRPHLSYDRRRAELHVPVQRPGDHQLGSARVRSALAEARKRRNATT